VLTLIEELIKILFGPLDEDNLKYYNLKMKLFSQNAEDMTNLLQQLYTVKSSLRAINNTVCY
jgi:hypothetical protein